MITYKRGDLLDYFRNGECSVVLHSCNTLGVFGGFAGQVKHQYPKAFQDYRKAYESVGLYLKDVISSEVENGKYIFNMVNQDSIGRGSRKVDYEALYRTLETSRYLIDKFEINGKIGIPSKLSSDLGGGSWSIVKSMILEVFKNHEVIIVEYDTSLRSRHDYFMDSGDIEYCIDEMVSNLCGTTSSIALSVIEKYIKSLDCNKNDLSRIKTIVDPYCSVMAKL
jgi:hypothetical protein